MMTMIKKMMIITTLSIPKLFTNAFTYIVFSHHYNFTLK